MVDVGGKPATRRRAVAAGFVAMNPAALSALSKDRLAKGDALATARIAGIQAAKRTADWIPLCHPLALTSVRLDLLIDAGRGGVAVRAEVETVGPTGVEMEALTAVAGAALTLYDMAKAVDRGMTIGPIELLEKEGGRSGTWRKPATASAPAPAPAAASGARKTPTARHEPPHHIGERPAGRGSRRR
jgi:cyclic pyranopterin phosphate synthase